MTTEEEFISHVFPNLEDNIKNDEWLCERAVLSPKKEAADKINNKILEALVCESKHINQ